MPRRGVISGLSFQVQRILARKRLAVETDAESGLQMPQEFSFSFEPQPNGFEIDLESEDWFRLPEAEEPVFARNWFDAVYGGACRAERRDLNSLLLPPDEDHPACYSDVSLILNDDCFYKRSLYLNDELRSKNILVSSITGGGKTQKFILPFLTM